MRTSLVLGAAGPVAWTLPALAPVAVPVARALRVPRRTAARDSVAVTFDDGPHPQGTPAVLELLAARGARATFFLVGEQVERDPTLAAEIVAAGHSVAVHGQRHRSQLRLTPRQLADDLARGLETIAAATGVRPAVYRPPYGVFSAAGLVVVRRHGLSPLLWSRWGHDWRARVSPQAIAAEATENLGAGDVLLLHDADHYSAPGSWRRTVAALPAVLDAIERAGLRATAIATTGRQLTRRGRPGP